MASDVHTITLDSNGGLPEKYTINVTTGDQVGALPTEPKRSGYTFVMWKRCNADGEIQQLTSSTVYDLDRDATYYADWKGVNRKVTFNSNGGTSVAQRNCENGSIIGKLPSTTLTGYNFIGWFTRKCDCGVEVSMFMPVLSDMTLYAHWEKMTYTVTFNPNNGQSSETMKVKYNDRLNYLPETPSKIGYVFKGWEADGTPVTKSSVITSNLNVNATWEAVRYEITYDIGGLGTVPASAKTEYTIESDEIVPPTPSAVTGYQFNEWKPVSIPKGSVGNRKFTGSWSVRKYTVTFNDNGGTSGTQTKTVEYMSNVGELPVSSMDGYDFDGWYTAPTDGGKIDESTVVTGDVTYYARWTAIVRNVYFDPCGGTVEEVEKTVTYNQEYGMLPTPYFNGHTFLGWYTTPSGGTRITEDSIFENYIDTVVYAQWKTWEFTVTFNGNGNTSGSVSNQAFTFGIAQELRQNAFKREYRITYNANSGTSQKSSELASATFLGWGLNSEDQHVDYLDKQSVSDLATSDGQTIQLYAKWKMDTVTLPNASKTGGYVFTGWYTNNDNSQSSGFIGNSGDEYLATENKTLYAHWHDDRITITYDKNFV